MVTTWPVVGVGARDATPVDYRFGKHNAVPSLAGCDNPHDCASHRYEYVISSGVEKSKAPSQQRLLVPSLGAYPDRHHDSGAEGPAGAHGDWEPGALDSSAEPVLSLSKGSG